MTQNDKAARPAVRGKGRPFRLHKAAHDPRAAALLVLSRVLFDDIDSQAALDEALHSPTMVPTDKKLCTELVYGVLRYYLRLRAFTEKFLSKPEKLPEEMRLALCLALYEMACLRIPHHASVCWAVGHVRNRFGQGLARVANGALRAMQRVLDDFSDIRSISDPEGAEEENLSRFYAMPVWIVRLWRQSYGAEAAAALLAASLAAPPSGLRVNRACNGWEQTRKELMQAYAPGHAGTVEPGAGRGDAEEMALGGRNDGDILPVGACGFAFPGPLPWQARILIKEGKASRQSAASYDVLEAFVPGTWELPIWDCCAGRGGKTLALLEQGIAVALASDPSRQRLNALPQEYARLGLLTPPCPETLPASVTEAILQFDKRTGGQQFGTILIDAPCSGLGTLSRHPEIRLRRTPEDLATVTAMQKEILAQAWERLKPGGCIVYITCTLNPSENQEQIASFLQNHTDAELLKEFQTDFMSPVREFFYGARVRKKAGL